MEKENVQILISRNKQNFILLNEREGIPNISTTFSIKDHVAQPCLILDINRIIRTQKLLKSLPSVFIMHSDGRHIEIDAISKMVTFNYENIEGIIQCEISNKETLEHEIKVVYEKIKTSPQYLVIEEEEETDFQPNTLKVFPITFQKGCMICIIDAVEKVLHCPLYDTKTGFIGVANIGDYSKLATFENIWPDLKLQFNSRNKMIYIYSEVIKDEFVDIEGQYYMKIHRNFGGSDLEFHLTHKVLEGFEVDTENK
jgi:hypothetical protein